MMKRYVLHFLVLLNVSLALTLAWMWFESDGTLRNTRWIPPAPHVTDFAAMLPVLPGVGSPDTSQFLSMLDRPLFSSTRRPPPPPPPPQADVPKVDSLSTATLSGLFSGDGVGGIIINIGGKHRRARLNEVIDGWTVSSIEGRAVTFTRGGESRVLQLPRAALTMYTGLVPAQGQAPTNQAGASANPISAGGVPPVPVSGSGGPTTPSGASAPPRAVFGGNR